MKHDYIFDSMGNRIGVIHENDDEIRYDFDNAYRRTKETRTNAGDILYEESFEYDFLGNHLSIGGGGAALFTTFPNNANQPTQMKSATGVIRHIHDRNGNLVEKLGEDGTLLYLRRFDPLNRMVGKCIKNLSMATRYRGLEFRKHETTNTENSVTSRIATIYDSDAEVVALGDDWRTFRLIAGVEELLICPASLPG